jgi:hypothetical protein
MLVDETTWGLTVWICYLGIISRAAQALFDKLDGPSKHMRNGSTTGLRTPQRYSMSSAASFGKLNQEKEKTWQLKATYVEVRFFDFWT